VTFEDKTIFFHSMGEVIKDTKSIFDKYVRENKVLGGYGLGLNMVQQIANRYDIAIDITSSEKSGTTFSYKFKCH
jgi:signal transduction histidine kinase